MSAPRLPNVGTMPSRALCLLLQGREISHLNFWRIANTYRLSDPIHQLRRRFRWDVQDRRETVPTGDPTKRSASVSFYRLSDEAISAAGEAGREFVRKVQEWEKMRASGKAGTGESAPADESAGTYAKGTDKKNDTTEGDQ